LIINMMQTSLRRTMLQRSLVATSQRSFAAAKKDP